MADELEGNEQETGLDIDAASDEIISRLGGGPPEGEEEGEHPEDEQAKAPAKPTGQSLDKPGKAAVVPPPEAGHSTEAAESIKGFDMARPPDTWGKDAQATWSALPPAAQQAIAKREGDIAKFVSESGPSLSVAKGFEKLLSPYAELYGRMNINPWHHIQALLASHATLVFGKPEQKAAQFLNLAKQAGIDLSKLSAGEVNADSKDLGYIRQLEERIGQLERGVTSVTGTVNGARLADLEAGVQAFASNGEAPFWDEVAADIPRMIERGARSLKDAYDMAVLQNPQTRGKFVEAERTRAQQLAEQQATERAAKAKKAMSGRVRASAQGRPAASLVGLDDFLKEQLGEIHSRH